MSATQAFVQASADGEVVRRALERTGSLGHLARQFFEQEEQLERVARWLLIQQEGQALERWSGKQLVWEDEEGRLTHIAPRREGPLEMLRFLALAGYLGEYVDDGGVYFEVTRRGRGILESAR